jgi:hypothetical protein
MPRLFFRLSFLVAPIACLTACGGSAPTGPTAHSIDVDTSRCEGGLETVMSWGPTFGSAPIMMGALAVGDDGTIYFHQTSSASKSGLYAIRQGAGEPVQIEGFDADVPDQVWVDGSTLLIASGTRVFTMPTAGGARTLISQLPPTSRDFLIGKYALDATALYVGASYDPFDANPRFDLYRVPRAGGDAVLIASSNDPAFKQVWDVPPQLDATNVYIPTPGSHDVGPLMSVPKTGGTLTVALPQVSMEFDSPIVLFGRDFYAQDFTGVITRYSADPGVAPVTIGGLDGMQAAAMRLAGDAAGVYEALLVDPAHLRTAIAPVPTGDERTRLLACTPPVAAGRLSYDVLEMAVDAMHIYALAVQWDAPEWAIWRVAR